MSSSAGHSWRAALPRLVLEGSGSSLTTAEVATFGRRPCSSLQVRARTSLPARAVSHGQGLSDLPSAPPLGYRAPVRVAHAPAHGLHAARLAQCNATPAANSPTVTDPQRAAGAQTPEGSGASSAPASGSSSSGSSPNGSGEAGSRQGAPGEGQGASPGLRGGGRGLYTKFVQHCMHRMSQRMKLSAYHIKDEWRLLRGEDGSSGTPALCRSTAASAPKIRFIRSADISAGNTLQVLNLVAFPRPTYDLPYFCADLVTFPRGHLIVLDLNPLFQSEEHLDKYIRSRMSPICNKYSKDALPWGGEFTSESLQFFSPALLWSRLPLDQDVANGPVFDAFCEYLEAWLDMVEECEEEKDPKKVEAISEAQHRYMCWRAEKDPGRPVLTRLFGSEKCEDYIHGFLFDGLHSLGLKGFLDYFPQYRLPDGSICKKRSMAGRSYTSRPWDDQGRLLLDP